MISKKTSKYYDLTFYHIISKHNYCFAFTRNRDQNLLVTICSINIVLHSKSFKYSLNILKHRKSHETSISIKVPFFLKQFHFQGGEANKRYPCKLCYSFPFKPQKVIKHRLKVSILLPETSLLYLKKHRPQTRPKKTDSEL